MKVPLYSRVRLSLPIDAPALISSLLAIILSYLHDCHRVRASLSDGKNSPTHPRGNVAL
jgi:hypothetical protein